MIDTLGFYHVAINLFLLGPLESSLKLLFIEKSKLPELIVKPSTDTTIDTLYSLVEKSNTSDNHLVFHAAFQIDRASMATTTNRISDQDLVYSESSPMAYNNDATTDDEENYIINHDPTPLPVPTLSI